MICPCKDCERKGCGEYHAQCEAYIEYAKYRKEINERERKSKMFFLSSKSAKRRNKWKK